jgi:phosphatidate cytidylyltransferase
MLGWRLTISAILIPALFGLFYLDQQAGPSAWWLFAICLLLGTRSTWELTDLLTTRTMRPSFPVTAFCVNALICVVWISRWLLTGLMPDLDVSLGIALATLIAAYLCFTKGAVMFREPGGTMETLGAELFTVFYCGVLLVLTVQLRWLHRGDWGYAALGSLIVSVKCGDIGAYTLGRLIGKRKMAPRLSPGKTWAGFGGALLGAAFGAWVWMTFAAPKLIGEGATASLVNTLAFGVVMGLVGLIGDLCESLIKRDVGRKDAAALFPGFGGLLDLLDSVLFAGPIALFWWHSWPLWAN